MTNHPDQIEYLSEKLETLLKQQEVFSKEISELSIEINLLKYNQIRDTIEQVKTSDQPSPPKVSRLPDIKSDLEKFIGENLINKIGIGIIIFGVAIGAKYSIERDLLSPVLRTILGYLTGTSLLAAGILLRKKYESYSAVLVSGAMAIMYFITYFAYSFYELIPQIPAFGLMVIFTVFTAATAIAFNRQVIAHIGFVGAYAVPFLLGDGSGNVTILFVYTAIINAGILFVAFRKYWKPLFYASFGLTWLMYLIWHLINYETSEHFKTGLAFLSVFFATFYLTSLAYKLRKNEEFTIYDIVLLLANSFIFYGMGYAILLDHDSGKQFLGLFTLANATIHFVVSLIIYKQNLADRNLFYLVSGLVLTFVTIAIPVELNGNWVTLLWAGEAALLFWIGRTKSVAFYEKLSSILMLLAFMSIVHDWNGYSGYLPGSPETRILPFLNIHFLTSLLTIAAFGWINKLKLNEKYPAVLTSKTGFSRIVSFSIPAILVLTIYGAFLVELAAYWDQIYADLAATSGERVSSSLIDISRLKAVWMINYTLLFTAVLSFVNFKRLRSRQLGTINLGLNTVAISIFLVHGLLMLSELREGYMAGALTDYYFNGGIRYLSYACLAMTLLASYQLLRQDVSHGTFTYAFDLILHISVLWVASSELINLMDLAMSTQSYKLGLSILWGIYAFLLIVLGIWKQKKHLRIGAISLFGVTLVKLFFFDISHLDTVAKTIVFVSLGILLLIISFLYNKYKHIISDELA